MLVSLNKNGWLNQWIVEKIDPNHLDDRTMLFTTNGYRDNRKILADMLSSKGYTSKVTRSNDVIISIPDEEFVFYKLKYN
jgi:hypothetical protein